MASYSRVHLSGSTNGKPIPVAATATPGTLLHTAVAGATSFDEIYLWAANVSGAAVVLTVQWGGTGDPAEVLVRQVSIPANSALVPIALGQVLNNGLIVRAFAGTASDINITGYINRITA